VHDWGLIAMAIGLNAFGIPIWSPAVLAGLHGLTKHDTTLNNMTPGSEFLETLAASPDPHTVYHLFAGNTSLPPAVTKQTSDLYEQSLLRRLLNRLQSKSLLKTAADPLFFYQPNDIAVSVSSMGQLPAGREHHCEPVTVACDHMSYFTSPEAVGRLRRTLTQ
jgi:hypothetical protein